MDLESPASDLPPVPEASNAPPLSGRVVAGIEVLLCSDYPTQFLLGATFAAFGYHAQDANGALSLGFVAALSLLDTVLLLGLVFGFLVAHGERPRDVFLGHRPIGQEIRAGLPMTVVVFGIALTVLLLVKAFAPGLHTVERNPLGALIGSLRDALVLGLVVVVAGGIREELQRAFLIHRFEGWLGGGRVGVVVASLAFGVGHLLQGVDAALATTLLGAFWAVVYLKRRSVIAPMVSHSAFNLLQIAQLLALGTDVGNVE